MQSTRAEQSQYAVVNREWQAHFEAENFKHLILGYSDVLEFGRIVVRSHRGSLVQWIWLRVELPTYGCDKCKKPESPDERMANEARFTYAIWNLHSFLSELDSGHPGISLELSVHSPSDAEHYCQELKGTMNDTAWYVSRSHERIPNDRRHGWRSGTRLPLTTEAYLRAFGNPRGIGIDLKIPNLSHAKKLPRATVVKQLVIRLQFFRHFSIRCGLIPIFQSLPQLESLMYECWQGINVGSKETAHAFRQRDHRRLVSAVLICKNLRRVSIYEMSSHSYCQVPSRTMDRIIGRTMGMYSGPLKELYISWMVDAKDFFHNFWPGATEEQKLKRTEWRDLEYLSLTTNLLPTRSCQTLLQVAATAAENMPKLKTMELGGPRSQDRFLYLVQDRQHTILVPRGMTRRLPAATIKHWQRVADIRGSPHRLKVADLPESISQGQFDPRLISQRSATSTTVSQLVMAYQRRIGNI